MRILQVVPTYLPATRYGGPIYAVHGLARALAARGHAVEVFTTNVDGDADSPVTLTEPVILDGVSVNYFPSRRLRRLYWSPELGRALDPRVRSFDIVHLHSVFLWPTWRAARAASRAGVPYVVSPRGMLVKELIRRRSRVAKTIWLGVIETRTLRQASAIHVTSDLEGKELRRFCWRLPRIAMIANGVGDPARVSEDDVAADVKAACAKGPLILFFGRISWKKGLDRLLDAFASTKGCHLVIAGNDEEGLSPALTQFRARLGLQDRVHFVTRAITGADKEYLFAKAQSFVLPSYSENFGNTVLEAMRRGLPVIVTPEVGAAEIVKEACAGRIVPGDAASLGGAMSELTENRTLAATMGAAGRRYVEHRYSWPAVAQQMEALYEAVLAERGHDIAKSAPVQLNHRSSIAAKRRHGPRSAA